MTSSKAHPVLVTQAMFESAYRERIKKWTKSHMLYSQKLASSKTLIVIVALCSESASRVYGIPDPTIPLDAFAEYFVPKLRFAGLMVRDAQYSPTESSGLLRLC